MKQWTLKTIALTSLRSWGGMTLLVVGTFFTPTLAELPKVATSTEVHQQANLSDFERKVVACTLRASKLRHFKGNELAATEDSGVSAVATSERTTASASQQCIECGRPCVLHGTPCCGGTENDGCWGVCEGKFPNTYCQ